MGKKNKPKKHTEPPKRLEGERPREPLEREEEVRSSECGVRSGDCSQTAQTGNQLEDAPNSQLQTQNSELPRSRLRRLLPDIIKTVASLLIIGLSVAVWLKPPLLRASSPYASYTFAGQTFTNAVLYRPLAVPTRFYVGLPEKLAGRYQWFTVDRRCEVAALADGPPQDTFLGRLAVRRNAPLGLDLEFRKLDGSEWQVFFFPDAVVFSNNVLSVRLDRKKPEATGDSK